MFSFVLILSLGLQAPESKPQAPAGRGAARGESGSKAKAATPEQALRTFLVAMVTRDETTLRAVTLPTKDFDWLLRGQPLPSDVVDEARAQLARVPIRALKPGDEIILPGNRKIRVRPEEVTAERAVVLPEGSPIPTRLRKVDGRWRVDATPVIAGRKAAEAARKKASRPESKKKGN